MKKTLLLLIFLSCSMHPMQQNQGAQHPVPIQVNDQIRRNNQDPNHQEHRQRFEPVLQDIEQTPPLQARECASLHQE